MVEGLPGVATSMAGRGGVLATQMLHHILHRLAPHVFGGIGGSDEEGGAILRWPHFEELVVQPVPALGV